MDDWQQNILEVRKWAKSEPAFKKKRAIEQAQHVDALTRRIILPALESIAQVLRDDGVVDVTAEPRMSSDELCTSAQITIDDPGILSVRFVVGVDGKSVYVRREAVGGTSVKGPMHRELVGSAEQMAEHLVKEKIADLYVREVSEKIDKE